MFGRGRVCSMGGGGCVLPVMYILLALLATRGTANLVLIGKNVTLSLDDMEANFAPTMKGSGESGALYLAEPLDACSQLTNETVEGATSFALIIRAGCTFDVKVRNAQKAGFKAAIVYDNEDSGVLVTMAGSPVGVKIHAVFISKASGEILKKYAGCTDIELWILPTFENSAWSIMALSFICLLAMSAVLAICFFVRRHRIRYERPRAPHVRQFHGMSSRLVKAMPSLIFTSALEDSCTSRTCAICLEDYNVGEKLRILPCHHKFHAFCVDAWLTTWRTFCPVCKRDANTSTGDPPASECTPLLSSVPASPSSSSRLSSFHSSGSPSPAIQIIPSPVQSLSASQNHSLSSILCTPHSQRFYYNSPAVSVSRSSADQRHLSSHGSSASHLRSSHSLGVPLSPSINSRYASPSYIMSSHSLGVPLSSPINSRYASPYIYGSSIGSPSYLVGSSSRRQSFLHDSSSATSLSALASAQYLPECPEC